MSSLPKSYTIIALLALSLKVGWLVSMSLLSMLSFAVIFHITHKLSNLARSIRMNENGIHDECFAERWAAAIVGSHQQFIVVEFIFFYAYLIFEIFRATTSWRFKPNFMPLLYYKKP